MANRPGMDLRIHPKHTAGHCPAEGGPAQPGVLASVNCVPDPQAALDWEMAPSVPSVPCTGWLSSQHSLESSQRSLREDDSCGCDEHKGVGLGSAPCWRACKYPLLSDCCFTDT